jgi:hypothetical protein
MTTFAPNQGTKTDAPQILRDVAEGAQDYSAKVLEFGNANINAAVEQSTKLSRVKSPIEFFALSNDYARHQFEIFSQQTQALSAIVQKMTAATAETVRAGVHMAV